jgi:hypothetical protein
MVNSDAFVQKPDQGIVGSHFGLKVPLNQANFITRREATGAFRHRGRHTPNIGNPTTDGQSRAAFGEHVRYSSRLDRL